MTPTRSGEQTSVAILGSTGSIGTQTLEIVRLFPERFSVRVLSAHSALEPLLDQVREFSPECVVVAGGEDARRVREAAARDDLVVLSGDQGLEEAAAWPGVDVVVTALVGAAGLLPTVAAVKAGRRIALANKETLVVAGEIIMALAREYGAQIIPVDSEHSAIFQCLVGEPHSSIEKLLLTASGGPFRKRPLDSFGEITPDEALQHPTWDMGPKVTIDSATMMNKGLEVLEARWLFGIQAERIEVVIHPQSIVHSMVAFVDGSVKAQLGVPSMKVPIQYALCYPDRLEAAHPRLNWDASTTLNFEPPDALRFPCLELAFEALRTGGVAPAVMNAANEEAVELFLSGSIRFTDIARLIEETLEELGDGPGVTIDELLHADELARRRVQELAGQRIH